MTFIGTVTDARNPNKVPRKAEIKAEILNDWTGRSLTWCDLPQASGSVFIIDGKYVPAVLDHGVYLLCGEYKTLRGVNNWLRKFYCDVKTESPKIL